MYAKVFAQIYDGSLCTHGPWEALVTFQQLLVLADQDGCVDMTAEAISRRTTIPLNIIQTGIAELMKPDPQSRTPTEEGRRIVLLSEGRDWGWRLVNYKHYRSLKREEDRREYHREYWHRRKAVGTQQTQHTQPNQPIAEAEAKAKATKTVARKRAPAQAAPAGVSVQVWNDWLTNRKAKRLPLTKTALAQVEREAEKAGLSLADAIKVAAENGWGGFKADWMLRPDTKTSSLPASQVRPWHQTASGIKAKGAEFGLTPEQFMLDADRQDWQAFAAAVKQRAGVQA